MAAPTARTQTEVDLARHLRESTAMLRNLRLPGIVSLDDLRDAVQRQTGRVVHLVPRPMPTPGPTGMWVSGPVDDYVFYAAVQSPLHRAVIAAHELGHVLFNDYAAPADLGDLVAMLMPDLDPAVVRRLAGRTTYQVNVERRAETFGSIVADRMDLWSQAPLPASVDPAVLARMVAVLEVSRNA